MIYLYSGTPGSGKSLHAASDIYWRLKTQRPVIANFEIKTEKFKKQVPFVYKENNELTVDYVKQYAVNYYETNKFKEGALYLFIDEAQRLFNCRDYNTPGRREWLDFFSLHRHYGYNIILMSQSDRMLDRQIRYLIENEYVHKKCSNFGKYGFFIKLFALGDIFVAIERHYQSRGVKLGQQFFRAHKKYTDLYDSFKKFEDFENIGIQSLTAEDCHGAGAPVSGSAEVIDLLSYPTLQKNNFEVAKG